MAQPFAGAMQPHSRCPAGAADHLRDPAEVKALPRSQQNQFPVTLWQLFKRVGEHPGVRYVDRRGLRHAADLLRQRFRASRAAALVGHHPPRAAQQPRQRVLRHVVQTAACDHEHLHHHVVGDAGIRPPTGIRMNRRRMTAIQALDALALFCLHTNIMSRNKPLFTPLPEDPAHAGRSATPSRRSHQRPKLLNSGHPSATNPPLERLARPADTWLVPERTVSNRGFILSATVISILMLGGWVAWLSTQPACGPPGNTQLAHIDRWAPGAFIVVEFAAMSLAGLLLKRTLLAVAVTLATIGGVAILCGALIAFVIAARGGCFS